MDFSANLYEGMQMPASSVPLVQH